MDQPPPPTDEGAHQYAMDDDTLQKPTGSSPKRGIIFRISSAIDNAMRGFFFRLGLLVANNPKKVILVAVLFMAATLAGMVRFYSESRAEELWVPQGTTALVNREYVSETYGRTNRFTAILFKAKDPKVGLATRAAFLEMLKEAETGYFLEAEVPTVGDDGKKFNRTVTYEDRCIRTSDEENNSLCLTISAFNLFYDVSNREEGDAGNFFQTVRAKIETMTDAEIASVLENPPPRSPVDGAPINTKELYAGADGSSIVQVMSFIQISENMQVDKDGVSVDEDAEAREELWATTLLEESPGENVEWFVDSVWGQEESLSEALSSDLPLLSAGFVLLAIYVINFLGDFHGIRSHRLLALAALATTGLALGTCFGLSSLFGMFYGPVHQILPLLVIAIGIDDCFHITRAIDEVNRRPDAASKPMEVRIALALSQSGSAITVTSFTNVAVFLLSAISRLPALRFFALWAAIGVLFAWVYAITFYAAFATMDARRIDEKRYDCCPCRKPADEVKELNWFKKPPGGFDRFFENSFGPFIMRPIVRGVLLFLFFAGLGASIYGCTQLYLKFRFAFFYPSGSSQREYQDTLDEFSTVGDTSSIYIRDRDLSKKEHQQYLLDLCQPETGLIASNKWVQSNTVDCWFADMRIENPPQNGDLYEAEEFVPTVREYLKNNARAKESLAFDEEGTKLMGCRFSFQFVYRKSNQDEIDGLQSVRETADSVGFGDEAGVPAAFPYSFLDTFTEQYAALPGEIGLSLGIASVAVAVVCLVLIGHPVVAAVSVVVVGMIIIGVLGLTYYTDINLNSVSVITLVLCTGISVDFVVHIARSFLEHVGTRTERAIKSLGTMGAPVFYAGFSTFLAIVIVSGARSYIFRVLFFGFFFLIILAFLHGLILGPILLSLIGPPSFYNSLEEKADAERQLEEKFVGSAAPRTPGDSSGVSGEV